jgi:protein-S-isoprenylcysteine O-methyltransferase Ste14
MQPASSERGANVRFPPPLIFVIWMLAGVLVRYIVMPGALPVDRWISLVGGLLLILLGVGIVVSARTHFVRTGQSPIPWKPSPELIVEGPYRFTRNPMYVSLTLIQIGLGAALNNFWICLFAPLALATVHVVAVRPEEEYLSRKFGDSYRAYLRRVRRYF